MSRFNLEILLGIILVAVTTIVLVVYGFNEEERMAESSESLHARAIEVGAGLYEINCSGCHGIKGEGILGLCPPLNDAQFFTTRLEEVGWSGSLEDYIISTVDLVQSQFTLVSTKFSVFFQTFLQLNLFSLIQGNCWCV